MLTDICICAVQWFKKAGFTDVKIKRIGPKWYRGVRRHGLIMGCSVTGIKPKVRGPSFAVSSSAVPFNLHGSLKQDTTYCFLHLCCGFCGLLPNVNTRDAPVGLHSPQ